MDLYIHPLSNSGHPGKFLIYRPLAGLAFVGNRAMAQVCKQIVNKKDAPQTIEPSALTFLQSIGFLDPDPPPPPSLPNAFHPTMAVLLMTNRCQLRCDYCYASGGDLPPEDLSLAIGKTTIDFVHDSAQKLEMGYFDVAFHGGGEPTVVWENLKLLTEYARQKPLRARITLTSNGIWSKLQREWILANLDGLSLSIDGRPQTQNKHRAFRSGQGSFDIVWQSIVELDRHNFEYGIRMTATPPWHDLPADIEFLCNESGCKHIQVEPSFHIQRGQHGDPLPGEGAGFISAFLEGVEIAEKSGRELVYSGARAGLVSRTFCTAPYGGLVVNGAGLIVSCYELTNANHPMKSLSVIGRIYPGKVEIHEKKRQRLHQLLDQRRSSCRDCFCYWSCAGDCYVRALPSKNTAPSFRGERCAINRSLTEALLLKYISTHRGVWRRKACYSCWQC